MATGQQGLKGKDRKPGAHRVGRPRKTDPPRAPKEQKKNGRPSGFDPKICPLITKLARLGQTDSEISVILEISERTFENWKKKHPELLQALREGGVVSDANVADGLYKRAIGYEHPDSHVSNYKGDITITPLTKHYPPDTGAATVWLQNRQKKNWPNKQTTELSGPNGAPVEVDLPEDSNMLEAARRLAFVLKQGQRALEKKGK